MLELVLQIVSDVKTFLYKYLLNIKKSLPRFAENEYHQRAV